MIITCFIHKEIKETNNNFQFLTYLVLLIIIIIIIIIISMAFFQTNPNK
jgi:hypothetical protein